MRDLWTLTYWRKGHENEKRCFHFVDQDLLLLVIKDKIRDGLEFSCEWREDLEDEVVEGILTEQLPYIHW